MSLSQCSSWGVPCGRSRARGTARASTGVWGPTPGVLVSSAAGGPGQAGLIVSQCRLPLVPLLLPVLPTRPAEVGGCRLGGPDRQPQPCDDSSRSGPCLPCGCDAGSRGPPPGPDSATSPPQRPSPVHPRGRALPSQVIPRHRGLQGRGLPETLPFTFRHNVRTAGDRIRAAEQTGPEVSVTALIIQTIEHKENSFKYIVIHAFDRKRYALSHEGGGRDTAWTLRTDSPPHAPRGRRGRRVPWERTAPSGARIGFPYGVAPFSRPQDGGFWM
ncbi:uncharacterized protein LOC131830243 [Mustela lutreola]|uniref:uncharacterized protein LOC131830243 n=1 Tax=Mustela lutreola TaxID=9666 RepID=UPI0027973BAA|nr:uncharacterized protein LOC131830243 [Mustela lutreola]